MTQAPLRPVVPAPDVEAAVAAVRARGMRMTASRRLVIEALFAAKRPVSAAEIAGGLDGARPPLDPASVYANLEALENLGLVAHVHAGHGPGLYVLADRSRPEYLRCEGCGALEAVEASVLAAARAEIRRATGYRAQFTHFPLQGLCPTCRGEDHR